MILAGNNSAMGRIGSIIGSFFLDLTEAAVIAVSIFLLVYLFLMQPHQVNGQSMVPTFLSGEYVLTDKISYRLGAPQRGDIIVFHAPARANCPEGTGCDYIKRVIALPGETVSLQNNTFFINGQPLPEPYIPDEYDSLPGQFLQQLGSYTLDVNEYFAVGDNRPYSSDSRAWGPIEDTDIVGRAFFRYWPVDVVGVIKATDYGF